MYQYTAKIINIVDGDTFDVEIDLGFHIKLIQRVRLDGVDTPELNSSDVETRQRARLAKAFIINLDSPNVSLETVKSKDKYGRYLAKVTYQNSEGMYVDLAGELIEKGFAVPYAGGKR